MGSIRGGADAPARLPGPKPPGCWHFLTHLDLHFARSSTFYNRHRLKISPQLRQRLRQCRTSIHTANYLHDTSSQMELHLSCGSASAVVRTASLKSCDILYLYANGSP